MILESGTKAGRWTIIKVGDRRSYVVCACGTRATRLNHHLRSGASRSCGCLKKEINCQFNVTHGMSGTRFYKIYKSILARTRRSDGTKTWHNYGGRGIHICKRWEDFNLFKKDMFESYETLRKSLGDESAVSIERIDNNGDYSPSNCVWIPFSKQAQNRRTTLWVSWKGEVFCFAALCRERDLEYFSSRYLLKKNRLFIDNLQVAPMSQ